MTDETEIFVTFGITSDGQNANKPVATALINGLKHALQAANANLDPDNQITSIHIMATTNGHGTAGTSNHLKGTAVDISRINGVKIATMGTNEKIVHLQEAMDTFPDVRENFGPYFKHKYFKETGTWDYDFPVSGHQDDIHISIR